MKIFNLIVMAFLMVATPVFAAPANDEKTPIDLIKRYLELFNAENASEIQNIFDFPNVRMLDGNIEIQANREQPIIDFATLKQSGWRYSKINELKLISEGPKSAMVELGFSRFNQKDVQIFRGKSIYTLTKRNGYWQIRCIYVDQAVPALAAFLSPVPKD